MAQQAPDAAVVRQQLGAVIELLTLKSLESTATLVEGDLCADDILSGYYEKLQHLSAMITLKEDNMNPRWNKVYGAGGTTWQGPLQDGRDRGGVEYFCPAGWARFSLDVCADSDFEERFTGWGYLYHGTSSKHVGSILASGFRGSVGLCFCGKDEQAVYMSPSIEYCSHPRYASIEYNPETKKFLQIVLQCRVNPTAVWKKCKETLRCEAFDLTVNANIPNDSIEWLFRPNDVDPATGLGYIKDAIVCTGIMVRMTDEHPLDLPFWWARDEAYAARTGVQFPRIEPLLKQIEVYGKWKIIPQVNATRFEGFSGCCWDSSFRLEPPRQLHLGRCKLSPLPFAKGTMRLAYLLQRGLGERFVLKEYNWHTRQHINHGLNISQREAMMKDVHTYMVTKYCAKRFVDCLSEANFTMSVLDPMIFELTDEEGQTRLMFGEEYIGGEFVKWNNNNGGVNQADAATALEFHKVASLFAHFTYDLSGGNLLVVDLQGWIQQRLVTTVQGHAAFLINVFTLTDPQIHTRSFSGKAEERSENLLYRRFSLGNMGRTGIVQFFSTHECNGACRRLRRFTLASILGK